MDQLQIVLCVSSMLSVYGVFPRAFRMNSSLVKKLYSREQAGIPAVWNSILAPVVSCGALQATCLDDSLSTQPESEVISGSRGARTALFDGPWPWVSVNSSSLSLLPVRCSGGREAGGSQQCLPFPCALRMCLRTPPLVPKASCRGDVSS